MSRMILDGEKLTDLLELLYFSYKERRITELSLIEDLVPQLKKIGSRQKNKRFSSLRII